MPLPRMEKYFWHWKSNTSAYLKSPNKTSSRTTDHLVPHSYLKFTSLRENIRTGICKDISGLWPNVPEMSPIFVGGSKQADVTMETPTESAVPWLPISLWVKSSTLQWFWRPMRSDSCYLWDLIFCCSPHYIFDCTHPTAFWLQTLATSPQTLVHPILLILLTISCCYITYYFMTVIFLFTISLAFVCLLQVA